MNRFLLFGFVLIALSCYFQGADAQLGKRYVYNVRRDVRHVSSFDEDYDEAKTEEKRFVYRRDAANSDSDMEYKRFVVSVKDAEDAAKNEGKEATKDYKRFVYTAREARGL